MIRKLSILTFILLVGCSSTPVNYDDLTKNKQGLYYLTPEDNQSFSGKVEKFSLDKSKKTISEMENGRFTGIPRFYMKDADEKFKEIELSIQNAKNWKAVKFPSDMLDNESYFYYSKYGELITPSLISLSIDLHNQSFGSSMISIPKLLLDAKNQALKDKFLTLYKTGIVKKNNGNKFGSSPEILNTGFKKEYDNENYFIEFNWSEGKRNVSAAKGSFYFLNTSDFDSTRTWLKGDLRYEYFPTATGYLYGVAYIDGVISDGTFWSTGDWDFTNIDLTNGENYLHGITSQNIQPSTFLNNTTTAVEASFRRDSRRFN